MKNKNRIFTNLWGFGVLGRNYVIPTPFDPRLIEVLPCAVAKAAMESGTAQHKIEDFEQYKVELKARVANQ